MQNNHALEKKLQKREEENALRKLTTTHNIIDFCSNDYLGFSKSSELKERYYSYKQKLSDSAYMGATGSRLISGNTALIQSLESFIASYHSAEAGLIFNSGYDANLGLLSSVPLRGDTVFYDAHVHASIRDGIRLSYAKAYAFRHNDMAHLEKRLKLAKGQTYVVVESVYSMDGDTAPLLDLVNLCEKAGAFLIIDEAHATGVFGNGGRGLVVEKGLSSRVFARVHTFGKALGVHGGIVLGSDMLRNYLINFARTFIYTTALPFHSYLLIKAAYDLLNESDDEMSMLHENIAFFKNELTKDSGSCLRNHYIESDSPIQCFVFEGNKNVKQIASRLGAKGFDIKPILSPTVAKGKERIRICLHSFNSKDEIKHLVKSLFEIFEELRANKE